jgi:hypothetical protein
MERSRCGIGCWDGHGGIGGIKWDYEEVCGECMLTWWMGMKLKGEGGTRRGRKCESLDISKEW